jgi:acetoacetyl-CoA reductase/3-oxoacyl-[acyl-carrier protein] reductase
MSDAPATIPQRQFVVGDKLNGRVAFVTGGARGIGAAISRSLASQGAAVGQVWGVNGGLEM